MANLTERNEWSAALPLVLLGIRSSLKEDIGYCSAELVYGRNLRLPWEILYSGNPNSNSNIQDFATALQSTIRLLQPVQSHTSTTKTFVSQDLESCSHVFVRIDAVRKPLQTPYEGPFTVIRRTRKNFNINRNGSADVIAVDRVKPTYLLRASDYCPP